MPDSEPRTLSKLAGGSVAVFFPDTDRRAMATPLAAQLLHGIERSLQRRSFTMIVTAIPEAGGLPPCLERRQVQGVIVRGTGNAEELCDLASRVPCVWLFESAHEKQIPGDMVVEDNGGIGVMAARWLLERGHRKLAFLNNAPKHPSFRGRRLFFLDEAEKRGAGVTIVNQATTPAEIVDRYLATPDRGTGIFIPGGDVQIMQIFQTLKSRGIQVGRDVDLISCNNDPHRLAALDPALPNIDIQAEQMGRAAVDLLVWRMRHPREMPRSIMIPAVLVEGKTHS